MPRQLSEAEHALCDALIRHGYDPNCHVAESSRERWLAKLDSTQVCGECGCGLCPSIELITGAAAGDRARDTSVLGPRVVLGAGIRDGVAIVLLFIDDDQPSFLEISPMGEEAVALPAVQDLRFPELAPAWTSRNEAR